MGVSVPERERERIDDKTSFVSLHSRTFITALQRSDGGSEEETNERTRSNALPVGSFTRRESRQKIVFLSGAERRERGPTILFRRCLWPPRNVFFLLPYFERLCTFFLAIIGLGMNQAIFVLPRPGKSLCKRVSAPSKLELVVEFYASAKQRLPLDKHFVTRL